MYIPLIWNEWADEEGNIAGEEYPQGFLNSTLRFFYNEIDPELRMPRGNIMAPTTENIGHYSDLIEEAGGADICYSGPGWTGHLAFIEPDITEFSTEDIGKWKTEGARVVTLNPFYDSSKLTARKLWRKRRHGQCASESSDHRPSRCYCRKAPY